MYPHHRAAIERLTEAIRDDDRFRALIIGGSIAKGLAREDSDVDAVLVAAEGERSPLGAATVAAYYRTDLCDYPGGYIDGKIVDLAFVRDVADRGSEVARSAFAGAWIAYSEIDELEGLLERIRAYPSDERDAKLASFLAQVECAKWHIGEAERRDDRYLLHTYATRMVLFVGRMLLAHNGQLYRYHKWLMHDLAALPEKPDGIMDLLQRMVGSPNSAAAAELWDCITGYREWPAAPEGWAARYIYDTEMAWRHREVPIEDR